MLTSRERENSLISSFRRLYKFYRCVKFPTHTADVTGIAILSVDATLTGRHYRAMRRHLSGTTTYSPTALAKASKLRQRNRKRPPQTRAKYTSVLSMHISQPLLSGYGVTTLMTKFLRMITVLLGKTPHHIRLPLCRLSTPRRLTPSIPQSCGHYGLSRRGILRPPNTCDRISSLSGSSLDLKANLERRRHPTNASPQVLHRLSSLLTEFTYECHESSLVLFKLCLFWYCACWMFVFLRML